MSLTREQYDRIMQGYTERQSRHRRLLQERHREVCEKIPEYGKLEEETPSIAMRALRSRLSREGSVPSAGTTRAKLTSIADKKRALLVSHGFPADYLEMTYDCPDCKDTGYIGTQKCHCFLKQEVDLLYDQSHLQDLTQAQNFGTLSEKFYHGEDLRRFRRAEAVCRNFVKEFDRKYQNLYLYGTVGTGKSFLSVCIADELLKSGHSVLYFSAVSLFDRLSSISYDYRNRDEYRTLSSDLYRCDLLIIDDLGTELTNSFVSSQLFSLLNERHVSRKATVISTNLSLEEMHDRYSDRIFSRITSQYMICKLTGRDIRLLRRRQKERTTNGTYQTT